MHASLLPLGTLTETPAEGVPTRILDCLLEHMGSKGTLAMPAFNFDFCRGVSFDRANTRCLQMGQLAETLRSWPTSKRSRHPLQSISAVGPLADELCDDAGEYAFKPDSAFGRVLHHDAWVLLFGADFQAASLIHCAEERVEVPYRYWKAFEGDYIEAGSVRRHRCWMYARDLALDPRLKMGPIESELVAQAQLKTVRLGRGTLRLCRARDLLAASETVLLRDRMALVGSLSTGDGKVEARP
jgi:aminoglycoside 3-N-acetyltransferase